jgi:hypothetical protein
MLESRELPLEPRHPRAGADPAGAQAGDHLCDFVIEDLGLSEYDKTVTLVLEVRSVHTVSS